MRDPIPSPAPQVRISVVTIVRNAPEELERTVASVVSQSVRPFQHLVVDGASTDRTLDIARAHAATHPDWVRVHSEKDSGIADALNKGTRHSGGDYVVCMNAGDAFQSTDSLRIIQDELLRTPPGAILYGDAELVYPGFTSRRFVRHHDLFSALHFWNPLCHQAMAVPREAMLRHPFDPDLRYSMDLDLWLHMVRDGRPFHHVNAFLCSYTMGGVSSRKENIPAIIAEHLAVYRRQGMRRKILAAWILLARLAMERAAGRPFRRLLEWRRITRAG